MKSGQTNLEVIVDSLAIGGKFFKRGDLLQNLPGPDVLSVLKRTGAVRIVPDSPPKIDQDLDSRR